VQHKTILKIPLSHIGPQRFSVLLKQILAVAVLLYESSEKKNRTIGSELTPRIE
jgi:hypothetical protein